MCRKEEERGLTSIEESIDAPIPRLEDWIEKRRGRLIIATRDNADNARSKRTEITRKQKWEEKQLYRRLKRLTNDIAHENTLMWLKKENIKREREPEFLLTTIQNNVIRTNLIKARIDKTRQKSKYRLCGEKEETITKMGMQKICTERV